jgi:hypothetical protein
LGKEDSRATEGEQRKEASAVQVQGRRKAVYYRSSRNSGDKIKG